ncbi:MAG: cAMP phosphodiesterase class-II:metallo-beta-lactamase superfamily protein [Gemmatales bacterium]|nr:MAG: cAMP phosphodiesterase class-II:metallo-beta-lactamase superfamily protein [Gemmatales bacterium]
MSAPRDRSSSSWTSYLINDTLALDAGGLGFFQTPQDQAKVRHVIVTHTHIDHIASLPIFLENVYDARPDPVTIHGSPDVVECLKRDILNDRIWPDFVRLSNPNAPFLRLNTLQLGKTFELEGIHFTPYLVNHVVPTWGFIIEDDHSAVVMPSDTGPTDEIWEQANRTPNVKAVFLEVTFPDSYSVLADVSKHLTPATFAVEIGKLTVPAKVIAVHIKARFRAQVIRELQALNLPNLEIGEAGKVYHF